MQGKRIAARSGLVRRCLSCILNHSKAQTNGKPSLKLDATCLCWLAAAGTAPPFILGPGPFKSYLLCVLESSLSWESSPVTLTLIQVEILEE